MEGAGAASARPFISPGKTVMEAVPGLLLCAAIALPAYELSRFHPSLDALAVSLILGIVLRNVLGRQTSVQPGVSLASKLFVPLGIIFYGAKLDFLTFSSLPAYTSLLVIAGMTVIFAGVMVTARLMGVDRRTGLLLASGSAICGASAIAVLSPVVGARSRHTSIALIVITTASLSGAIMYPLFADWFAMSERAYGLFCGWTLQQTGLVKLAASHMGDAAVAFALPVKMVRIAMLVPATVLLAGMSSFGKRGRGDDDSESEHDDADYSVPQKRAMVSQAMARAWFIPLFIAMAVIFSFSATAGRFEPAMNVIATVFLSLGLASIGLTVDLESIKLAGPRPLMAGFAAWSVISLLILLVLIPLVS